MPERLPTPARGSNRRALSGKRAILKSALIGVVRGLGHGVHDSLEIGSLEWYSCQVWAFSSPETDIDTYVQIIGLGDPLIPIKVI